MSALECASVAMLVIVMGPGWAAVNEYVDATWPDRRVSLRSHLYEYGVYPLLGVDVHVPEVPSGVEVGPAKEF